MDDLLSSLLGQLQGPALDGISGKLGVDKQSTGNALQAVLPVLLGGLTQNTRSTQGVEALAGALDKDHDGSILDNLTDFIGNAEKGPGAGILKHILGDKRPQAEEYVSQKSGLNSLMSGKLMEMVAPLLLGMLGKQKKSAGLGLDDLAGLIFGMNNKLNPSANSGSGGGLGDILGDILGGASKMGGGSQSPLGAPARRTGGGGLLSTLAKVFFRRR